MGASPHCRRLHPILAAVTRYTRCGPPLHPLAPGQWVRTGASGYAGGVADPGRPRPIAPGWTLPSAREVPAMVVWPVALARVLAVLAADLAADPGPRGPGPGPGPPRSPGLLVV